MEPLNLLHETERLYADVVSKLVPGVRAKVLRALVRARNADGAKQARALQEALRLMRQAAEKPQE